MKAIETNIHRHENGTLYFVARRHGKLHVQSLRTQDLEEARRILREKGTEFFFSSPSPKRSDNRGQKEKLTSRRATQPIETPPTEIYKSPEVNKPSPAIVVHTER
jgi:hypothetical protein